MFRPGKILRLGGNSNGSIVIDITNGQPEVDPVGVMTSKRQWVSATVLADGRVLATGGSLQDNTLNGVNNKAKLSDPTEVWTGGPEGQRPRLITPERCSPGCQRARYRRRAPGPLLTASRT